MLNNRFVNYHFEENVLVQSTVNIIKQQCSLKWLHKIETDLLI